MQPHDSSLTLSFSDWKGCLPHHHCGVLQLGAICHSSVTEDVTHVVSTAKDTDKMHWAKRHNRHRVSPNWLYLSGKILKLTDVLRTHARQALLIPA